MGIDNFILELSKFEIGICFSFDFFKWNIFYIYLVDNFE